MGHGHAADPSPVRIVGRMISRCEGARSLPGLRRQMAFPRTARTTVAPPDAVSVHRAPMPATIGPPMAVPSGDAMTTAALRAASTLGRLAVVVIDWKSAYVSGTKGPYTRPPTAKQTR